MAKEKNLLKAIPPSEIQKAVCITKSGKRFQVTYNPTKDKFTLWRKVGNEFERFSTSNNPLDFDKQIDYNS